jgi:hypothetical protein
VLVKLCVAHQSEYFHGQKGNFWKKISQLLEQEHGIILKEPRSTMQDIMAARRAEVEKFKDDKMSGRVQEESELTQNVDLWIEREDELKRQRDDAKKGPEELEKEKKEAAAARRNMMVTWCEKNAPSSADSADSANDGKSAGEKRALSQTEEDSEKATPSDKEVAEVFKQTRKKQRVTVPKPGDTPVERATNTLVGSLDKVLTGIKEMIEKSLSKDDEAIKKEFREFKKEVTETIEEGRAAQDLEREEDRAAHAKEREEDLKERERDRADNQAAFADIKKDQAVTQSALTAILGKLNEMQAGRN